MPELPEVETTRRGLAPHIEGRRVQAVTLRRPDLRFPFPPAFSEALEGRRIDKVLARPIAAAEETGISDGEHAAS